MEPDALGKLPGQISVCESELAKHRPDAGAGELGELLNINRLVPICLDESFDSVDHGTICARRLVPQAVGKIVSVASKNLKTRLRLDLAKSYGRMIRPEAVWFVHKSKEVVADESHARRIRLVA